MADKFDYVKAANIATDLIYKFGQFGLFVVKGSGGGGFDDFGNPIPAQPDKEIVGVITPLLRYKQHEIDGERILATDSYIFADLNEDPPIDSKVTINGNTYIAKNIMKLDSVDGINIYRKIQLRK